MEISSTGDNPAVLAVSGEVDLATAPDLEAALDEVLAREGTTSVEVDLAQVEFMDSAGLRVLVAALNRAGEAGIALRLRQPHERVRRIIEITGLSEVFGLAQA